MSKSRILLILSAIGLAIGVLGLIVVAVLFGITNKLYEEYSVVLDAGSSSTKLNLFKWRDQAFRTNAEVQLVENLKVEGGISNYINTPFEAYKQMAPTLQKLVEKIPSSERSGTPVFLAATAGMRLRLLQAPLDSLKLFEVLRRGLLQSGLQVETPNERIRLLSGAEEGLYGWVSVNSILNLISASKQVAPLETVGSLDLGGASTQIAFVPNQSPPSEEASVDFYPLNLFGTKYQVYSHSFLCYGKNEFERRIKAAVIGDQTGTSINHPCFLAGYVLQNQSPDDIFDSPCVTGSYANKVFASQLTKPAGLQTFNFNGTGNAAECKRIIEEQFNTQQCTIRPCSFNSVYQPPVHGDFRAYAGYSFVMAYLFKDKVTGFTTSEVETAVSGFCARPWAEVAAEPDAKYATKYCFDGYYVLTLLKNLGFKTDVDFGKITFGAKINGDTVSWALGYMLDQTGNLPSEVPKIYLPLTLFAILVAIFLVMILLSIVGLVFALRNGGKGDSS